MNQKLIKFFAVACWFLLFGQVQAKTQSGKKSSKPPAPMKLKQEKMQRRHQHHQTEDHNHGDHEHTDQQARVSKVEKDKITIEVNGMVCAFCAQGITKSFNKMKQVKNTRVDLDKMQVHLDLKPGMIIEESQIKKVITDAGFKFVGLKN